MGDVPTTINVPATLANKALKIAMDFATDSARAAMLSQAPWLGAPVVSQVFDYILGQLSGYFYKFIALKSTFAIINFQSEAERDQFMSSMWSWNESIVIGESDEEIMRKREKVVTDFRRSVRWNGSARP